MHNRTFRLFISSTFGDFAAERLLLQNEVFPKLEQFCADRGVRFQAVDLRWGISSTARKHHETMRICLEEIRRSQELSPRPNFVALLGDRYGWEPIPARITVDDWQRLMGRLTPAQDRRSIRGAYEKEPDRNAEPPVYRIKQRTGDGRLDAQAATAEKQALKSLRIAVDRAGFSDAERVPYFSSATHQEIVLGALEPAGAAEHVHVYVRRLEHLPRDGSATAYMDWDKDAIAPVVGAQERILELEAQLRHQLPGHVHDLPACWTGQGPSQDHLAAFGETFYRHQVELIERELASLEAKPAWQARAEQHEKFAQARALNFSGRKALVRRMQAYLQRKGPVSPLIVQGGGGTGKSALLAHVSQLAAKTAGPGQSDRDRIISRFIGGVPGSESLPTLLDSLIEDISRTCACPIPEVDGDEASRPARQFKALLSKLPSERPLCLFLDALDQLADTGGAPDLRWLPEQLPPHVRLVISVREGTATSAALARLNAPVLDIPRMSAADGAAMLSAWLASSREARFNAGVEPATGRDLTPAQRSTVMKTFAKSRNPLWMKLAYEEARTWHSGAQPQPLPDSVDGMVHHLLHRLVHTERHPEVFTRRALAYIAASRFGLAEDELARALGQDADVREEFSRTEIKRGGNMQWAEASLLPPILWSRLRFDLDGYLTEAAVDGTIVLRFFHREFQEVLSRELLSSRVAPYIHGILAEVFRAAAPQSEDLYRQTDVGGKQNSAALRRVMEEPWQLTRAGRYEDAATLLTDFGFCMAKCAANRTDDLLLDLDTAQTAFPLHAELGTWSAFVLRSAHFLRRHAPGWSAHRILLQLAADEPAGSFPHVSMRSYEAAGWVSWPYPKTMALYGNREQPALMLDAQSLVMGAIQTAPNAMLSWEFNGSVALWNTQTGKARWHKTIHGEQVVGVLRLDEVRCVSWSRDGTLSIWSIHDGVVQVSADHRPRVQPLGVQGVCQVGINHLMSWSLDGCFRVWPIDSLRNPTAFAGPEGIQRCIAGGDGLMLLMGEDTVHLATDTSTGWSVETSVCTGALSIKAGQVLVWDSKSTTQLMEADASGRLDVVASIDVPCSAAVQRPDGSFLLRSGGELLLVAADLSVILARERAPDKHPAPLPLADGRVVMVSKSKLQIWNPADSQIETIDLDLDADVVRGIASGPAGEVAIYIGQHSYCRVIIVDALSGAKICEVQHSKWVNGVQFLGGSQIASWSAAADLRISSTVAASSPSKNSAEPSRGLLNAIALDRDRILLWGQNSEIRLWQPALGTSSGLHPPLINGADKVDASAPDHLLLWNEDRIQVRHKDSLELIAAIRPRKGFIAGACMTLDSRVLAWFENACEVRLWELNAPDQPLIVPLPDRACGARGLNDGRVVAWLANRRILVLNPGQNSPTLELNGASCETLGPDGTRLRLSFQMHDKSITKVLQAFDGTLWSWSQGESKLCHWDLLSGLLLESPSGCDDVLMLPHGWLARWHREDGVELRNLRTGKTMNLDRSGLSSLHRPTWEAFDSKQDQIVVRDRSRAFLLDGLGDESPDGPICHPIARVGASSIDLWAQAGPPQEAPSAALPWFGNSPGEMAGAWPDGQVLVAGTSVAVISVD